jgi:hypothetical protein
MLATSFHSRGVTVANGAYCLGADLAGALGRGNVSESVNVPSPVAGDLKFQTIVTGLEFSCALDLSGAAYCWGLGDMTGTGATLQSSVPVAVTGGLTFTALTAGQSHVCGLPSAGALYCWGHIDDVFSPPVYAPQLVPGLPSLTAASTGFYHTCALASGGVAYCWIVGEAPNQVATDLRFAGLTGGQGYSCGFTPGGAAYCWSIEIGTTVPTRVPSFPGN